MNSGMFENETALLEHFCEPAASLEKVLRTVEGPIVILGAGGKMGPSLSVMILRSVKEAGLSHSVVAVSRFTDPRQKQWLEAQGVQTVAADLLNPSAYDDLPDAGTVLYLVGLKFGTQLNPERTWVVNTLIPSRACARYPGVRMVALSTGNVYPMSDPNLGGSVESDPLTPLGEYANAAVARERILGYCSTEYGIPLAILRLNYALDLRYGVLVDLATQIWRNQPVDVTTGYFNAIWLRDANIAIVRALSLADRPHTVWNLTGKQTCSVRETAQTLASHLSRECRLIGTEADQALLSHSGRLWQALDLPLTPLDEVMQWTAQWIRSGGRVYGKPTRFQVRDGQF